MKVIILRGLPGSGKSTWRCRMITYGNYESPYVGCSADDYHITKDGVTYKFDPLKAGEAHSQCLRKFLNYVSNQECTVKTIIVDNTNTTAWEIAPYYAAALAFGHDVEIVTIYCDFETCCKRNIHGVPHDKIMAMHRNLYSERLPAHWKERIVFAETGK